MKKTNWIKAGKLGAAHKLQGEIKLHFEDGLTVKKMKTLLCGASPEAALPFVVTNIKAFTNNTIIVQLDELKTREAAMKLSGKSIWVDEKTVQLDEFIINEGVIGYKVIDVKLGEIGLATDVYQMPAQTILNFVHHQKDIMLPSNSQTIVKINHPKKEILVALPDGLLEVYN